MTEVVSLTKNHDQMNTQALGNFIFAPRDPVRYIVLWTLQRPIVIVSIEVFS